MPQLDPSPWLFIMATSWLTFLLLIPSKLMAHQYPHDPSPQNAEKPKTTSWDWPWH
uniref:ATP synthase complex subunit 8 n=1 Tax=Plesiops nakaharae TaxID=270570 RepID=A0A1V1FNS3_9TELE|nr:ATP synthase F0 subunit 8 [Plesiops nakaharae]BAX03829.1 ATPase subunit 8 [Plesiops nakaharae]BBU25882.1 ATPase subunit 8 [Plesiops nakaharae]